MSNARATAGKLRLAVLTLHPIHYQAALWRRLAREPDIDTTVFFCTAGGLDTTDPVVGYGQEVEWGVPLLHGYRYRVLRNLPLRKDVSSFWCRLNPGVVPALAGGRFDALFVHSYHNCTQLLALVAARRLGLKVLVRSEPTPLIQVQEGRRRVKEVLLPWLFRQADACMAIGSLNREYYRHYGVPDEKIFLMPYAVDNEYFFGQREIWGPQADRIKVDLGIPAKQVVLYVGRFEARKRVLDLVQAFAALDLPQVALALVGTGDELAACRQYVAAHHLPRVHFLGFRNQAELPKLYAMADVFALPSENEPWGLVVNEAMCFGLPVIASDRVGAAPDLVAPGRNGFVYPCGEVPALTQTLRQALAPGAKERLGPASREIISRWDLAADLAALRQALLLPPRGLKEGLAA